MMSINIGDRVRFRSSFLRSTGQQTGEVPRLRGEVIKRRSFGSGYVMLTVKWDNTYFNDEGVTNVCASNLEKIKQSAF